MDENNHHANSQWLIAAYDVLHDGGESAPRGKPIKELVGYQTKIDMEFPLVTIAGRKMGYKFAAAEAAWILSGDNRVETIAPFSKAISNFSDNGETFFGAYGPKIKEQLPHVINSLLDDRDSRQAVINIWRESPPKSKDIPCSVSVQFLIRNGYLHCIYTMRSSDLWLGWVYDVFNFTMLASMVLLELRFAKYRDLRLGYLSLTAGSQHIYQEHWEVFHDIINGKNCEAEIYPEWNPAAYFTRSESLVNTLWSYAHGPGALQMLRDLG